MTRDTETVTVPDSTRRPLAGFGWGTVIFTLGGLVGLGGAEFRLPVLIGVFRFPPLEAVFSDNHRDRCRQPRWPVAAGVGRA